MNWVQRTASAFGLQAKGYVGYVDTEFFVRALTLSEAITNVKGFSPQQAYSSDSVVYGAISACATNLSQVPFLFYEGEETNPTLIENSPWEELFARPNPQMSRYQLWEATEIYMKLRGECLWIFEFDGRSPRGQVPTEIFPQDPLRFQPIIDKQANLIAAWEYRDDNGQKVLFEHGTEVLQFKKYNPYNRWRGLSPLQAAALGLRMGHNARVYNDATMVNMGEPGGVLSTDSPLGKEAVDTLREQFEARHQGPAKAKRLAILHSGLKYQQTALAPKDMEFLNTVDLSVEDILSVLRVPKTEVFRYDDVRKETAEVQDRALWTKNLMPEMAYLEDALWSEFFSVRGDKKTYGLFQKENIGALQENLETKARTAQLYFQMGWPLNQINARFNLGMEEVPWGDVGYLPLSLVPATMLGLETPDDDDEDEEEEEEEDDDAKVLLAAPKAKVGMSKQGLQAARRMTMRMRPLEQRLRRRLERFFYQLRQAVLEVFLRESRSVKAPPPALVDHVILILRPAKQQLQTLAAPFLKEALGVGGDYLGDFGLAFAEADPRVRAMLQRRTGKITGLVRTLETQLRRQLTDGYAAHESMTELANRLRDVFNFANSRSLTIARTELHSAANEAAFIGQQQAGIAEHEWVTAGDELVRDSHAAQQGEVVALGDAFSNGLSFPGDPAGPPEEIINCRCVTVPVFGGT